MSADRKISIALTNEEALVLFELLQRWEDEDSVSALQYAGEDVTRWRLAGHLEKQLVEIFDPAYDELVSAARARLTSNE